MFAKEVHQKSRAKSSIRRLCIPVILVCILWCTSIESQSQSCLPIGIEFTTQSQIDSFQINFPGCIEIEGMVSIRGSDITNLNGLSVLTSIGGSLEIKNAGSLANLDGLENVTFIGGSIDIFNNSALSNLSGLINVTSINGDLMIEENYQLYNLTGLDSLTSIGNNLYIIWQGSMTNLTGLESLTSIGGVLLIYTNWELTSLTGLDNLTSVGDYLGIVDNPILTDLTALNNVTSIGGKLWIKGNWILNNLMGLGNINPASIEILEIRVNDLLQSCEVQSICDYISLPYGYIDIGENAVGCNNEEEIQAACDSIVSVGEQILSGDISIYPNPASFGITISGIDGIIDEISIFNKLGQRVIYKEKAKNTIDISWLPEGLYIVEVVWDGHRVREKVIVQ